MSGCTSFLACFIHENKSSIRAETRIAGGAIKIHRPPVKNTFLSATELSAFIDGEVGHDAVKAFQLINGKWVEFAKFVIGPVCILDLLDFFYRPTTVLPSITPRTASIDSEFASMASDEWMERIRLLRRRHGFASRL